jgi:hypothetical protein
MEQCFNIDNTNDDDVSHYSHVDCMPNTVKELSDLILQTPPI